jgi:hypothetical protein
MKPSTTTTYTAFDGSIFNTATDCADYETHCNVIASIIDQIPRFPIDEEFMRGGSFYQHDSRIILPARDDFFKHLDSVYNNPTLKYPMIRMGIGERVLMGRLKMFQMFVKHNDKASMLAWVYLGYTDDYFKQWGQLMFAIEPPEDAVCINP